MSDDLPIFDFADQLHDDLLMKRRTDSDNTGFSNDLEKGASVDEVPKTASRRVFLQPRYALVTAKGFNRAKASLDIFCSEEKELSREE